MPVAPADDRNEPPAGLARLVSLACHDLRTPLATVYGFVRTLGTTGDVDEKTLGYLRLMEAASQQMTELLDELSLVARIVEGRWEPALREADTLELARADDARIGADGAGEVVETAADQVAAALRGLALAAVRHGGVERVTWRVEGRTLRLTPVDAEAAPVLTGEAPRDLGALAARVVLEAVGASLEVGDGAAVVTL